MLGVWPARPLTGMLWWELVGGAVEVGTGGNGASFLGKDAVPRKAWASPDSLKGVGVPRCMGTDWDGNGVGCCQGCTEERGCMDVRE